MKNIINRFKITAACCLLMGLSSYALESSAATSTYYCAPTTDITFTQQAVSYAPYWYSSAEKQITSPTPGIQPSLSGQGNASQVIDFHSAVWSDQELLCNYDGLTDQSTTETMVMYSDVLSVTTCHFSNNKTYCDSSDPTQCAMTCINS